MGFIIDNKAKLAQVWCSHTDQKDAEKQQKLKDFIADCEAKKIFVCVFNFGNGDLKENTKELFAYNYNNSVTRGTAHKSRDEAR